MRHALLQRLLPFTGLVPVVLIVPLLAFDKYAIAICLGMASGVVVITYHVRRGQGVTSLDVLLLGFASLNAVLYFGFGTAILIKHIDAVIYTLLALQAAYSLLGSEPWTTQFTRRVLPPEVWSRPEFHAMNRFATALWLGCFAVCDVIALVAPQPLRLYLPIGLMVVLAVISRPLSRAYLARQLGVPVGALPAEWALLADADRVDRLRP
jgi:hypothetical protein